MSFLDNLENNLKALESRDEKDPEQIRRDRERQDAERNAALLRAPYAEALKQSAFTNNLLTECRTIGHGQRVLVQFTWLGEKLRLDARAKRLELIPTPEGIAAVFSVNGEETTRTRINVEKDDPAKLAKQWLTD